MVWGVEDEVVLDEIEVELLKDCEVICYVDGWISCKDDMNFEIVF